jgi:PAS domain S-box-containing protein
VFFSVSGEIFWILAKVLDIAKIKSRAESWLKMSIRTRGLLLILAALASGLAAIYIIAQTILLDGFTRLEENDTHLNVERALAALAFDLDEMDRNVKDWAFRDDTYKFIQDQNEEYIASNLGDSTFVNLRLDLIVFVNSAGQVVYQRGFDFDSKDARPVPPSLHTYLNALNNARDLLVLPEGVMLVAAQPILTSASTGPARGTLLFARFLDDDEIARLAKLTRLWLHLAPPDDARLARAPDGTILVAPVDAQTIGGSVLLKDVSGAPARILEVRAARAIVRYGRLTIETFLGLVASFSLLMVGIGVWQIDRRLLMPLARLHRDVQAMRARENFSARVAVAGVDEIAMLGGAINRLTDALQASIESYRTLVELSPDAIALLDLTGKILLCNQQKARLYGYASPAALIGVNVFDLIAPDEHARATEYFERVIPTGGVELFAFTGIRRDGTPILAEATGAVIKDALGAPTGILAITRDVSARKRAEAQMRLQSTALAAAANGIVITDRDGAIIWCNPAFTAMTGYAPEEALGHNPRDLVRSGKQDEAFYKNMWATILAGAVWRGTLTNRRKDGVEYTEEMTITPVRADSETISHFIAVKQDITERERVEEETRRRARQLELLYDAGLALNRVLEPRAQLETLCTIALQATGARDTAFFAYDPARRELNFEFGAGNILDPAALRALRFALGEPRGIVGAVAAQGAPFYLADVSTDPRWILLDSQIRSAVWIPILHNGTLRGVLTATHAYRDGFTSADQQLLALFAHQIAIAMENARLYQAALAAADRRAILHHASQEVIAAGIDLERVYRAAHHATEKIMPCEAFVIALRDDARAENRAMYLVDRGARVPGFRIPANQGLTGRVVATGVSLLIDDLDAQPESNVVHFGDPVYVRAILAVPLRVGDRVIGMMSAQSYQPRAYTPDDQTLLEMLAAHVAVVIENARLFEETRRRLGVLEALSQMSTALRAAKTLEQMYQVLLDKTAELLSADAATVWLFDPAKNELRQVAARGFPENLAPVKPGEGIAGEIFSSGTAYVSHDFKTDPRTAAANRANVPHGLRGAGVPIRTVQEAIGVLFVSVREPDQLTHDQIFILTTLAEMAGNAIHRQRLHDQTERRLHDVQTLRTIDLAIASSLDLNVTLNILLERLRAQMGASAATVWGFNAATRTLEFLISHGDAPARPRATLRVGEGFEGRIALERRVLTDAGRGAGARVAFGIPLIAKGEIKGVLVIDQRAPFEPDAEWMNFLETVASQAAIAIDNAKLFEGLQRTNIELALAYETTIEGWSRALDLRDQETEGHTQRVTEMTMLLARAQHISETEQTHIRRGALLHDIGKMGVPDAILRKPGALTPAEWELMRQHPAYAYQVLAPIAFLRAALDIPYCHHEKWDGTGYPRGLRGEQIPLAARLFAIADVWDALTSDRPYRAAWSPDQARAYIREQSGKHFDPQVVEIFFKCAF